MKQDKNELLTQLIAAQEDVENQILLQETSKPLFSATGGSQQMDGLLDELRTTLREIKESIAQLEADDS